MMHIFLTVEFDYMLLNIKKKLTIEVEKDLLQF